MPPQSLSEKKLLLPEFPRTPHLPWQPNASADDLITSASETDVIFNSDANNVYVEEKIDGASVGIYMDEDDNPVIRNSEHILSKGYVKKSTPAKLQFRPLWNWFYDNKTKFAILREQGLSLYGEWMWMQHGMVYDLLPDWLIAYDLFEQSTSRFLDPAVARGILFDAGFDLTPLYCTRVGNPGVFDRLIGSPSVFSTLAEAEGLYVKVSDGRYITHRFKRIRPDFKQGSLFSQTELKRNSLA